MANVRIVVPTYNERENITPLLDRIFGAMVDVDVLFVLDASPDGTLDAIQEARAFYGRRVDVLYHIGKSGLASAYQRGFAKAITQGSQYIVQMDADLSHRPEYIPQMLALLGSYDVVVGSRYCEGGCVSSDWPMSRRVMSRAANALVRKLVGVKVHDATSGFKAFRGNALETIMLATNFRANGFAFQVEVAKACQWIEMDVAEYPICFDQRAHGESKLTAGISAEVLQTAWRLRK